MKDQNSALLSYEEYINKYGLEDTQETKDTYAVYKRRVQDTKSTVPASKPIFD